MIEERNELLDGPLEINIVLPERVVGVDEEGLVLVLFDRAGQIRMLLEKATSCLLNQADTVASPAIPLLKELHPIRDVAAKSQKLSARN
jgi:hypothetical protein